MKIEEVLKKYLDELTAYENVIGVAIGSKRGKLVIQVQIKTDNDEAKKQIPDSLEGFDVDIIVMDAPELF
jgi:hypothetical protein